eukprot:64891_1
MELSTDKTQLLTETNKKNKKRKKYLYVIVAVLSAIVITLLILNLWQAGYLENEDEETIVINECSGNGHTYNDVTQCECFQCYSGNNCEIEESNCSISAGSGQPYLLIEYWTEKVRKNKIKPMITPADYRMPYNQLRVPYTADDTAGLGGQLNQIIRRMHSQYHNVNMTDSVLIFGAGATQLNVATYAAYSEFLQRQITAFVQVPYYASYPRFCAAVGESRCVFNSSEQLNDEGNIVEYITIPNNPDGFHRERVYKNCTNFAHDLVYYWPMYYESSDDLIPLDAPVSFFSITKLTGHAGTRFGWAFVKNISLAMEITGWIYRTQGSIQVDSVNRAYELLSYFEENGDEFFDFIRDRMKDRFDILLDIIEGQNNYILKSRIGAYFAWIECVGKNEIEIINVFASYNLSPNLGSAYGQPGFIRLGMTQFEGNFQRMMDRFRLLVDNER